VTDQELAAAIEEARQRARAHTPGRETAVEGVAAADLMPLVHARDAAEAKVAAIGTVNPRPPGLANAIVQWVKRGIARLLEWHVREQVEFNRAAMECVQATLEALNSVNRSLAALAAHQQQLRQELQEAKASQADLQQRHLAEEIRVLRTISELQAAYQHRLTVQQESAQQAMRAQHRDYLAALERTSRDLQQRLWEDLGKVRRELEDSLYQQARVLRQTAQAGRSAAAAPAPEIDWLAFADRFRGTEEHVRLRQDRYVRKFLGAVGEVLDVGCGRGEFLEAARAAGIRARGVEWNAECVALCRNKGLEVEQADLFTYLAGLPDQFLGGVYCSQVVEHLSPAAVARFVELAVRKLRPGAWIAIETPNPECLAIFATHFYIDPTHVRPVPAALLRYYLMEAGCGAVEVEYLDPAVETLPELAELPERVREKFFGGLDYAIFARKL
jgi:O-antigen chain-terminating methyltransferase